MPNSANNVWLKCGANGASKVKSVVIDSRATATSLSSCASNLLFAFRSSIIAAIAVLNA